MVSGGTPTSGRVVSAGGDSGGTKTEGAGMTTEHSKPKPTEHSEHNHSEHSKPEHSKQEPTKHSRLSTYLDHAIAASDLEAQGRFKKQTESKVTGVPIYPKQPSNSPWHSDPV